MKKIVEWVLMLFSAILLLGTTGCIKEDIDYSDATPPAVEIVNSVTGAVLDVNGNPISNATVNLAGTDETVSTTTDAQGLFKFDNVKKGSYVISATATGKQVQKSSFTIGTSTRAQVCVEVLVLSNEKTVEVEVKQNEDANQSVTTETTKGNEDAQITQNFVVPAVTPTPTPTPVIPVVKFTPIYSIESVGPTVDGYEFLTGTTISCAQLTKPESDIKMFYPFGAIAAKYDVVVKRLVNGAWQNMDYTISGDNILVMAPAFTTYVVLIKASISKSTTTEDIAFEQDDWNNIERSTEMTVPFVAYTYKQGTKLTADATKLGSYLKEILARKYGVGTISSIVGNYVLNVTLPIGTRLIVNGTQLVNNITITTVATKAESTSASVVQYADVSIYAVSVNCQHTGGSN